MKIFNLAEELEEERKKNKELEKQVEELKIVNKNAKQTILDYQEKTNMLINSNCQLNEYIEQLEEKINKLTAESTHYESKYYNEAKKVDKTIEYIEKYKTDDYCDGMSAKQLLDILKGSDNNE